MLNIKIKYYFVFKQFKVSKVWNKVNKYYFEDFNNGHWTFNFLKISFCITLENNEEWPSPNTYNTNI